MLSLQEATTSTVDDRRARIASGSEQQRFLVAGVRTGAPVSGTLTDLRQDATNDVDLFRASPTLESDNQPNVRAVETRVQELEKHRTVTVHSLAPEPYRLRRPLICDVHFADPEFVASFADAGIHMSGDTVFEAVGNAKAFLVDVWESLQSMPEDQLGPLPRQQLAVLSEFIVSDSS